MPFKDQKEFFGGSDGDGLSMQFDFIGMQRIYLSMARGDAGPLAEALRGPPDHRRREPVGELRAQPRRADPRQAHLSERQEVFDAFGPDPDMQLFDRGLRRRLPTMLGGDMRRIKMVYSLMFSLPGTPVLFYGEEIGMGENLDIDGRMAVRTPMQWDADENGGFSTASARRLPRPLPDGLWGPENVNVADQRSDPDSLWSFIRRWSPATASHPRSAGRTSRSSSNDEPSVLAHVCRCGEWGCSPCTTSARRTLSSRWTSDPVPEGTVLRDVLDGRDDQPVDPSGRVEVRIDGYRGQWLRVLSPGEPGVRLIRPTCGLVGSAPPRVRWCRHRQ